MPRDRSPHATADVLTVVVCYQPQIPAVTALVRGLLSTRRTRVLVVDNTEAVETSAVLRAALSDLDATVLSGGTNVGVAEAHNIGLRYARAAGHQALLLLDQDTELEHDALDNLIRAFDQLKARGEPVAGVGAAYVDPRGLKASPFVRLAGLRMRDVPADKEPVACDLLISSGSLISLDAVDAVGPLDSRLFIDYVDFEWCARARAQGWKVFGVPSARMRHTVGDSTLSVLGHVVNVHAPQRQYYLIRNALLFARKPYLPLNWRVHLFYRAVTQLLMFSLLCAPRWMRARWLLRGFWDGLRGRGGRLGGAFGLRQPQQPRAEGEAAAMHAVEPADRAQLVK